MIWTLSGWGAGVAGVMSGAGAGLFLLAQPAGGVTGKIRENHVRSGPVDS